MLELLRRGGSALRPAVWGAALALLLAACAAPGSAPPQSFRASGYNDSLLWQVEKDGTAPSYIFATILSSDPRLRDLLPEVRRAFEASEIFAFESVTDSKTGRLPASVTELPAGLNLEDVLGPQLFRRVAGVAGRLGVPAEGLQRLKPWAVSAFLNAPPSELARSRYGQPSFPTWLKSEALRLGKTPLGLESAEEEIAIFDAISVHDQVVMIDDLMADYWQIAEHFERLVSIYLNGDAVALRADVYDVSRSVDADAARRLRRSLIDDRSRTLANRMLPLLETGAAFVAVGAVLLPGETGILRRLELRGYRVTRVR